MVRLCWIGFRSNNWRWTRWGKGLRPDIQGWRLPTSLPSLCLRNPRRGHRTLRSGLAAGGCRAALWFECSSWSWAASAREMSPLNAEPGFGNTPLQFGVPLRHAIAPAQWHPSQLLEVAKSTGLASITALGNAAKSCGMIVTSKRLGKWWNAGSAKVRQIWRRSMTMRTSCFSSGRAGWWSAEEARGLSRLRLSHFAVASLLPLRSYRLHRRGLWRGRGVPVGPLCLWCRWQHRDIVRRDCGMIPRLNSHKQSEPT